MPAPTSVPPARAYRELPAGATQGSSSSPYFPDAATLPPPPLRRWQRVALGLLRRGVHVLARLLLVGGDPAAAYERALFCAHLVGRWGGPLLDRLAPHVLERGWTTEALLWLMSAMTRQGHVQPRLRLVGFDALARHRRPRRGLLLLTAHFGLTDAIGGALEGMDLDYSLIARGDTSGWGWGCRRPVAVIPVDGRCLVAARARLRQGQVIVAYPDQSYRPVADGGTRGPIRVALSPNLFRFGAQTGAPVLFLDVDLDGDGAIRLEVIEPRRASVRAFRDFVTERTDWRVDGP
ncbi:hypothetical protein [Azospirillum sp. B4]|uniref:hypothetical protein n=1 Tax=Azospirillum sp. B4 TaxID=95605 RepID=UPI0003476E56|nr:hypothetical protein [Azospirillum sp. B4]